MNARTFRHIFEKAFYIRDRLAAKVQAYSAANLNFAVVLNVKSKMHHVAVLNDVVFAL